jgi:hypothetical protein
LGKYKPGVSENHSNDFSVDINKVNFELDSQNIIDLAFEYYHLGNNSHKPNYERTAFTKEKNDFFEYINIPINYTQNDLTLNKREFKISGQETLNEVKIAVASTKVIEDNIKEGLRNSPNLGGDRFDTLYKIFKQTKEESADMLLFPECFIPIELLDRITWYAVAEQKLIVTGLEHITINNVSFNFIVTILPFEKDGVKDALVVFRLKNHYSHEEKRLIETNHFNVPTPFEYVYDLFIWKGLYFSPYYCFELANVYHRSLFKSQIDLLVACEWNPDINYFSNIVESISRDLHAYVAQVNTSQYGDTRITQPAKTEKKDILKLKGGENDTILVGNINLDSIREFQRQLYLTTKDDKTFKPLPPDYIHENVLKRINNESIL